MLLYTTREVGKEEEDKREKYTQLIAMSRKRKKQLYALVNHPLFALKQRTEFKNLNLIA
jgi:hypothetical protein